jgi:hypothetical protein
MFIRNLILAVVLTISVCISQSIQAVGNACSSAENTISEITAFYSNSSLSKFVLRVTGCQDMEPIMLVFNTYPNYTPYGVPMPLSMGFLGVDPGCNLYFEPIVFYFTPIGQNGEWGVYEEEFDCPAISPFSFMVQSWILDPSMPGMFRVSAGYIITV